MALLLFCGTVFFASSSIRMAVPLYGLSLLLGLLWVVKLLFADAVSWKKNLMHIPVAAFAFYALLRYSTSPIEYESRLELFQVAACTLIYFVAVSNFYHPQDRTLLFGTILILALAETGFGIWQFATKAETIFGFERASNYYHRAGGTFFCPNHLAGFLEMAICLVMARLAIHASSKLSLEKLALQKVILIFAGLILAVGLLATLSRGGLVCLIIGLTLLLPLGGKKWGLWFRVAVVVIGVSTLTVLALKNESLNSRLMRAYVMMQGEDGKSANIQVDTMGPRIKIWGATLTMIREHPLWGTGGATWEWLYRKHRPDKIPGNPQLVHNDYLNLLSDYGLAGFVLLGFAITCFFAHAYGIARGQNNSEERSFAVGSAMAVAAILAHSMVDFNLHVPSNAVFFMVLMGFTVAIDVQPRQPERIVMPVLARRSLALGLLLACAVVGFFFGRTALAGHYQSLGDELKMAEPEEAIGYYKRAILLGANNPHPYVGIGDVYFTQSVWRKVGSHKEERIPLARQAIEWYEKALVTNPYYAKVLLRMMRAYDIIGDREMVIKTAERAIEVDPLNPSIYNLLGDFYMRQNEPKLAKAALQKAKEYDYGYNNPTPYLRMEELERTNKVQ